MATDTMWVKTHKALNDFMQVLTCKSWYVKTWLSILSFVFTLFSMIMQLFYGLYFKSNKRFSNPQQFLNCGHYACAKCIGHETDCVQCKIPGEVSDIYADSAINELLLNLNIIAKAVGQVKAAEDSTDFDEPKSPLPTSLNSDNTSNINFRRKRTARKVTKSKTVNDTLNTSICESTMSRSTFSIPRNIDKKNNKGETALHIACRSNNIDRVKVLLDAGAKPNTKDNAGWTPLQEATSYGYEDICELLLKAGASPNMHGLDNRTALHEAVIIDDCDLVSLLINYNANREAVDNVGKKPKDYCKSKKMTNLFKSLQDSESNNTDSPSEITLNMNKTLNTFSDSKIILYGSNLKLKSRKLLSRLCVEKKVKVVNNLSPTVSHVIIDTDSSDNMTLTFDVLLTILFGKLLLNSNCLSILLDNENITSSDLNLFEVNPPQLDDGPTRARENFEKQNPKLFNNCCFYFAIKSSESFKYDGVSFTKDNLMKLVAAGDGIILTREPRPDDIQGSLSPFHAAHDPKHSLHKCTHYIIYLPDNLNSHSHSSRIIYNMPMLKTLPLMWFIESILRYELLDPVCLGLTPQ